MTDLATFLASAERLRTDLAQLTHIPTEEVKQTSAESLVVLREAGDLVLPALRKAAAGDPVALEKEINGPVTDLVNTASRAALPNSILWGNVASVIASAAGIVARETPEESERLHAIATNALSTGDLAQAWTGELGATFRRTTCCQVTARDERRCGDCVRLNVDR